MEETHAAKLQRFKEAMGAVYGPLDEVSPDRISEWVPPESPGAGGHRGRYLWTDAFGVVNLITLSRENENGTSAAHYLALAKRLAETVHDVLGRTREDGAATARRLPGATDARPLDGGLRIGKVDEAGPDGDGQYHHYLTLWMFALNRLALATGEARWNDLAIQLAQAIHPHFVVPRRHGSGDGGETMVWKISMDMRRVLVGSKGHLDDVTGMAVFRLLQETAQQRFGQPPAQLQSEAAQYERMVARSGPLESSDDPLDLGMSLWISHFEKAAPWSQELAGDGLDIARRRFLPSAVSAFVVDTIGTNTRRRRLAFRDFGACLGIKCYSPDDEDLIAGADAVVEAWAPFLEEGGPDLRPITLVMGAAASIPGAFRHNYLDT